MGTYYYTDLIPLSNVVSLTASYEYQYSVAGWALYDKDQEPIFKDGKLVGEYDIGSTRHSIVDKEITYGELKLSSDVAEYIRFSSN